MLTQKEVDILLSQVNKAFEADRARLNKLEERVKALESSSTRASKAAKEDK